MVLSQLIGFDENIGTICCGIDEAGRGALAGPVYAAAVCIKNAEQLIGLNDSKKLSPKKREQLFLKIQESGSLYGVGTADVAEIAELNILSATMLACGRAYAELLVKLKTADVPPPQLALMDGNTAPKLDIPVRCVVGGDACSASIAAASIVAKVLRDRHMRELSEKYPQYGFEKHNGYGTAAHRFAIASIAAASIVAKVLRDRHMRELSEKYPQYGFEKHNGYGTAAHRFAILEYGACAEHRELFLRKIIR